MQKAKVATNPGPAALLVINGGKKMATKRRRRPTAKRRTTAARRKPTTVHASNPARRHTRRASTTVHSRRRSVARRRNPATGGLIAQAAGLAAGITAVGLVQSFIPPIGGNSPFMVAARQAATGYLVGEGMQRFRVMPAYANDVKLAGFALGVGTLINAFILPTVSGFLRPAPRQQQQGSGMQGIAAVPSIPAYLGAAPVPAAQGVNGIAVYQSPGRFSRR